MDKNTCPTCSNARPHVNKPTINVAVECRVDKDTLPEEALYWCPFCGCLMVWLNTKIITFAPQLPFIQDAVTLEQKKEEDRITIVSEGRHGR